MGTVNATLLSAGPSTAWVNATFSWLISSWGEREAGQPSCAPGRFASVYHAARGEFPASRGVLILTHPEEVGGNEVRQ